jgi:hypothetical protein
MTGIKLTWIAWPAFLAACLLELITFAVVDPHELQWAGHTLELSRQAVYTLAFFVFWGISAVAAGMAALLAMPPEDINRGDTSQEC